MCGRPLLVLDNRLSAKVGPTTTTFTADNRRTLLLRAAPLVLLHHRLVLPTQRRHHPLLPPLPRLHRRVQAIQLLHQAILDVESLDLRTVLVDSFLLWVR